MTRSRYRPRRWILKSLMSFFAPFCRPGLWEIMSSLLRLEQQQKGFLNPFWIRMFLFLFYSFGIETINTFIHFRSCSKTIPDPRPKWVHLGGGGYIPIWLTKGVPPPLRILSVQDRASRAAHSIASTFSALYTLYRHARCSYSIKINIIDINRSFNLPTDIDCYRKSIEIKVTEKYNLSVIITIDRNR